jgi:hypothetical protein
MHLHLASDNSNFSDDGGQVKQSSAEEQVMQGKIHSIIIITYNTFASRFTIIKVQIRYAGTAKLALIKLSKMSTAIFAIQAMIARSLAGFAAVVAN